MSYQSQCTWSLPYRPAPSEASQTDSSVSSPPQGSQADTNLVLPHDNPEASSYSYFSSPTTSSTPSIFSDDTTTDASTLSEEDEPAIPAIYSQFRHLSGPAVMATVRPKPFFNNTSVIATIPPSALLLAAQAEQLNSPPVDPLPMYSAPENREGLLDIGRPSIITAGLLTRRIDTATRRTFDGSTAENRGTTIPLTEQNGYLGWAPLGRARAGNAARPLGEQWRMEDRGNVFENGFFMNGDTLGHALEPEVLAVVGGELEIRAD